MADDSVVPKVLWEAKDGIFPVTPAAADLTTYDELYISGNRTVTKMASAETEANVRKRLGYATAPFKTGYDSVVKVQTKYKRLKQYTAGATITAGQRAKLEYSTGAINGQVIPWQYGTDDADQDIGLCWYGGVDGGTVEIFEE